MPVPAPRSRFGQLLDYALRAEYAGANALRAGIRGDDPLEAALTGIEGGERTLFGDVFREDVGMSPGVAATAGFLAGALNPADPVNYVPFGKALGLAGKGVVKATPEVVKSGLAAALKSTPVDNLINAGYRAFSPYARDPLVRGIEKGAMAAKGAAEYDIRKLIKPETISAFESVTKASSRQRAAEVMDAFGRPDRDRVLGAVTHDEEILGKSWQEDARNIADHINTARPEVTDRFGRARTLGKGIKPKDSYLPWVATDELHDFFNVYGAPKGRGKIGGAPAARISSINRHEFQRTFKVMDPATGNLMDNPSLVDVRNAAEAGTIRVRTAGGGTAPFPKGVMPFKTDPEDIFNDYTRRSARAIGGRKFMADLLNAGKTTIDDTHTVMWGPKGAERYFAPEQARDIQKVWQGFNSDPYVGKVARTVDKVMGLWKAEKLFLFPAYHVRNIMGNVWNSSLASDNIVKDLPHYINAHRQAIDLFKKAKTGALTPADDAVLKELTSQNILHSTFTDEALGRMLDKKGATTVSEKVLKYSGMQKGAKIARAAEDQFKVAHYLWQRTIGKTEQEAGDSVRKYLFDYSELSDLEKNVFRRVVPFWTFARKNLPLQLEHMVTKPGRYVGLARGAYEAQSAFATPQEVESLPPWSQGGLNVPAPFLPDEGGQRFIDALQYLPTGDPVRFGTPGDAAKTLLSSMSPLIKTPIEYAMNRNIFTGRETEAFPGETDSYLGVELSRKFGEAIKGNSRVVATTDRLLRALMGTEPRSKMTDPDTVQDSLARYLIGRPEIGSPAKFREKVKRQQDEVKRTLGAVKKAKAADKPKELVKYRAALSELQRLRQVPNG